MGQLLLYSAALSANQNDAQNKSKKRKTRLPSGLHGRPADIVERAQKPPKEFKKMSGQEYMMWMESQLAER